MYIDGMIYSIDEWTMNDSRYIIQLTYAAISSINHIELHTHFYKLEDKHMHLYYLILHVLSQLI